MSWETPSPAVRELIRTGARLALEYPDAMFAELDAAVLATESVVAEDPVLSAAATRSNRANIRHWIEANAHHPGEPVSPNAGPEPLAIARDLVRRGLDGRALDAYRVGQTIAWRFWMNIAFELTDDPSHLRELLDVTSASISAFVEETLATISDHIRDQRSELTAGTHAERREIATLLISGAPITLEHAEFRLGYRLDGPHTAAVVWSQDPDAVESGLERVIDVLTRGCDPPALTVLAGASTRWLWLPGSEPDISTLTEELADTPAIRVAFGPTEVGVAGFRTSHLHALTVQRMLDRLSSHTQVAHFAEVELVAMSTHDRERADEFVTRTLGPLVGADTELHDTLSCYIRSHSNASRTAELLFTHRNTVLRRLARAETLLPNPLATNLVEVAVALDLLHWSGAPPTRQRR